MPPGSHHMELANEIVFTAGSRPRDEDVPVCVRDVLGDGRDHVYRLDVLVETVRTLRITMDGAKIQSIGEGGTRLPKVDLGPDFFLVGPLGCEITGLAYTPDLKTFFVNIQHPTGNWPVAGQQPRSSTIVVRRTDAQPVGN